MTDNNSHVSYIEFIMLINVNLIIVFVGIILWYFIWIKEYGGLIPNPQISNETNISYFNSKNFGIVVNEILKRFNDFNKNYLLRSIGTEAYVFRKFFGITG